MILRACVLKARLGKHAKRCIKSLPKTEQVGSPVYNFTASSFVAISLYLNVTGYVLYVCVQEHFLSIAAVCVSEPWLSRLQSACVPWSHVNCKS